MATVLPIASDLIIFGGHVSGAAIFSDHTIHVVRHHSVVKSLEQICSTLDGW